MVKRGLAFGLFLLVLCGLAYYSGYLFTLEEGPEHTAERNVSEENQVLHGTAGEKTAELTEEMEEELPEEKQETSMQGEEIEAEILLTEQEPEAIEQISYYLVEEFGYVNIYLADKESLYEYTDITIDSLPEDLQLEICTGKGVTSEQELYDFLENYSS